MRWGLALLLLAIGWAPPAAAQMLDWETIDLGRIEGLVDLRASPHAASGLIALTESGGWRALGLEPVEDGAGLRLTDAGEAPFMGKLAPPEIVPDGRVGVAPGPPPPPESDEAAGTPSAAWFEGPTRRYAHGALGDQIEASILQVAFADRRILAHRLPESAVFEDLEPRIVDADGDGDLEVLAVKSMLAEGSTIALYDASGDDEQLFEVAEAEPIGTPNRWLNPAAVADFDGDGAPEIAVVRTPHIGGILIHYAWDGTSRRITEERRIEGYSTHASGSVALGLATPFDIDGDGRVELILPRQDRHLLAILGMADGAFEERAVIASSAAPVAASIVAVDLDRDGDTEIVWGLADGSIRALTRRE